MQEGVLVVVSGSSGVGKGTILRKLVKDNENIKFAISATTRKPRPGEVDGVDYFFKTEEEFRAMMENDELVEWVNYCGNFYGKSKKYIEEMSKAGYDLVVEVEVEGAKNVKKVYPDSISVFILPPSFEDLERRLRDRGTESEESIQRRLKRARDEQKEVQNYDYTVVNDEIDNVIGFIIKIINDKKHSNQTKGGI
ncbi:MAG: guanylate kinase [Clostridiales bacterium]|nr:guanylate kinase [Clostridiales bacterium]